jgi:hypothetical protein
MKKCSTSLAMKGMQITTTLRFHLTPVRMAMIKGNNNNCSGGGCGEILHIYTLLMGVKISTATMKSSMEMPQKAKDRTAIRSSDTTPGHLPKER